MTDKDKHMPRRKREHQEGLMRGHDDPVPPPVKKETPPPPFTGSTTPPPPHHSYKPTPSPVIVPKPATHEEVQNMMDEARNMIPEPRITIGSKPYFNSWTVIFNTLVIISVFADWALTQNLSFVSQEWYVGSVGMVNVILRVFKTNRPITLSSHSELESINRHP